MMRHDDGFAIAVVSLLGSVLVLFSLVITSRTLNETQIGSEDRSWEQAVFVAESGVDQALRDLDHDLTIAEVDLGTAPTRSGAAVAAEAAATADPSIVVSTPEGEVVALKQLGADRLYAVGFVPDIAHSDRIERVIEITYTEGTGVPGSIFPEGAIVANEDVTMTGNGSTQTDPATSHAASVYSNGNYTGTGNSEVDGDVVAAGSIIGGDIYGTATPSAPPVPFPSPDETDAWQAELQVSAALGGETTPGFVVGNHSTTNLTAPILVTGDVTVRGTLVIGGSGVVYVDGDITMTGQGRIENGGVLLAASGTISQSGQSSYLATGQLDQTALVSFAADDKALELTGGSSSDTQGVAYAPNGGAKLTGNGTYVGAIIAGGTGSNGGITMNGNGTVMYPEGLVPGSLVLPQAPESLAILAQREL